MQFSPNHRKSLTRRYCCVPNCTSKNGLNSNLSFHRIPKPGAAKVKRTNLFNKTEMVDKHEEWIKRLKIKSSSKDLLVCSLHFDANDYNYPDVHAKLRKLKKDAVPKVIIHDTTEQTKENNIINRKRRQEQRHLRLKDRAAVEEINVQNLTDSSSSSTNEKKFYTGNDSGLSEEPENHDTDCEEIYTEESMIEPELDIIANDLNVIKNHEKVMMIEKGTQVTTSDLSVSFASFIKNEKHLMTMCNIKSFAILNKLTDSLDRHYPKKRKFSLTTRDCVLLTTAKLKLDISFAALAIFFYGVTVATVRNIFYDTLQKLAHILESNVTRVSKEEILCNIPKSFKEFKSMSVLDCTEIYIQQPKCLKCRIKFYSHYKGHCETTVKFMTEATPAGTIVSVSEAFRGEAPDCSILNHSGNVKYLESTKDAMVDKDSLIDNELLGKEIKLNQSPFIRNKKQLTEHEIPINNDITYVRVNTRRMNQRIKQFLILSHKYPWHMIDYIDDIFLTCCGLINLENPILAEDKF